MIHSASPQSRRPTVKICFVLPDFEKWGRTDVQTYKRTDGHHVWIKWSLPTGNVGRPSGSRKGRERKKRNRSFRDMKTEKRLFTFQLLLAVWDGKLVWPLETRKVEWRRIRQENSKLLSIETNDHWKNVNWSAGGA